MTSSQKLRQEVLEMCLCLFNLESKPVSGEAYEVELAAARKKITDAGIGLADARRLAAMHVANIYKRR